MRIRTLTCHDVYNYGASLQAYALMKWLQNQGHDVQIIDYKPEYMCDDYSFWILPQYVRENKNVKKNIFLHLAYSLYLFRKRFATWRRIKPFKIFKAQYLKCTRVYKTLNDLRLDPPASDIYIAGSDQIWNVNLTVGNDPAFYLDFGDSNIKRISYAASFALESIPDNKIKDVYEKLCNLDSISVREEQGLKILSGLNLHGQIVADPVFLLARYDWISIIGNPIIKKMKYIFVYDLYASEDEIKEVSFSLKKKYNIPIVVVNGKLPISYGDITISNAGPIEFLNYLYNAAFVVTDSFHASAFSIIFNKPFAVFNHKENRSRIIDLLNETGLITRYNTSTSLENVIDWNGVNERIDVLVQNSKSYLKTQIG